MQPLPILSRQLIIRQEIFLNGLINKSPCLCQGALKREGREYFLITQSLKVSQRWEIRASSGLFRAYAWPHTCTWVSRLPGTWWNISQPSVDILLPGFSFFLFCSVSWHYQSPAITTTSNSCHIKRLPLSIFTKYPSEQAIRTEWALGQGKWRRSAKTGQTVTFFWGWSFWAPSHPSFSLRWLLVCLCLQVPCRWFAKPLQKWTKAA